MDNSIYPLPRIIINEVCEYNAISLDEFYSKETTRIISQSRHQAIFLIRNITKKFDNSIGRHRKYYLKEISKIIKRHKDSIRSGYKSIDGLLEVDRKLKSDTEIIKENCYKQSEYNSYQAYLLDKISQYQIEYESVSA